MDLFLSCLYLTIVKLSLNLSTQVLHMDLHMVSDLVSGNSPMNKVLLGFFRGQDIMLSLSL